MDHFLVKGILLSKKSSVAELLGTAREHGSHHWGADSFCKDAN